MRILRGEALSMQLLQSRFSSEEDRAAQLRTKRFNAQLEINTPRRILGRSTISPEPAQSKFS